MISFDLGLTLSFNQRELDELGREHQHPTIHWNGQQFVSRQMYVYVRISTMTVTSITK